MDMGDNVIVINADKVVLTGNKRTQKTYYRHTGYPGGIKEAKADKILDGRFPERVLEAAVKRMMPGGPLSRAQLSNLRIYGGSEHPHEAQQPAVVDVEGHERQELPERLMDMAEETTTLENLGEAMGTVPAAEAAPAEPKSTTLAAPTRPASARTRLPASGSSAATARSPSTAARSKLLRPPDPAHDHPAAAGSSRAQGRVRR
jgi:hypothetical protein